MSVLELDPLTAGIRTLTDEEANRLRSMYSASDLPPTPEQCITCGGTGTFKWWHDGVVADWRCNCIDQWKLHRYLLNAGIGLAYQRLGWADAHHVEQDAIDWVYDYADHAEAYVNNGLGLVLHGTNGSGKTLLAVLLLKMLLSYGHDGYFTTFQDLLTRFTTGWRDPDEQRWFHRRIKNASVLVVDDLGKEGMKGTEVPMATFEEVTRHRVAASRPMIVTTNYGLEDLTKSYQGSVMSLLKGSCMEHRFTGSDYRPEQKQRTMQEAKLGLQRPVVLG